MNKVRNIGVVCIVAVACLSPTGLTGCTDYWWSRGQPPSVETLLLRAQAKLDAARSKQQTGRAEIASLAQVIEESLLRAVASIEKGGAGQLPIDQSPVDQAAVDALGKAQTAFIALEGKMSVGSLAPYGELSGQLRVFIGAAKRGDRLGYPAVGLFTARTLSFLASELALPSNA